MKRFTDEGGGMKRFTSYDGIDFGTVQAGLADFEGFSRLHCIRQKKLAILLIESRVWYDYWHQKDTTVLPSVSANQIKRVLGSIKRIAEFARDAKTDPAAKDAMLRIMTAAELRDATNSTAGFFGYASTALAVAKEAEKAMAAFRRQPEPVTAIVWLCGSRLPTVYADIFGVKFTTTRGNNPGIEFVQSALRIIKVRKSISDETILSHLKAAHRG